MEIRQHFTKQEQPSNSSRRANTSKCANIKEKGAYELKLYHRIPMILPAATWLHHHVPSRELLQKLW